MGFARVCLGKMAVRNSADYSSNRITGDTASGVSWSSVRRICSCRGLLLALHVLGNLHAKGFYPACGFDVIGANEIRLGIGLLMPNKL